MTMTMLPLENRAEASAWSGPSAPGTLPTSAPIGSPERKSRTLQGPTAKEWAKHRETIVALYKQYPLKRVSELMRRHYGFVASKRMYDKRFREWNVFKNGNSEDGTRAQRRGSPGSSRSLASASASASTSTAASADGRLGENDPMSQVDIRRAIRGARSVQHEFRRAAAPPSPLSPVASQSTLICPVTTSSTSTGRSSINISDLISDRRGLVQVQHLSIPSLVNPPASDGNSPQALSSPDTPYGTPCSTLASGDETAIASSDARSNTGSPGPNLAAYKAQIHVLARSPPPSLADPKTRSLKTITLSLRDYYDWQLQNIPQGVLPDEYLGNRTTLESTQYWGTIKNALYLIKLSAKSLEHVDNQPASRAWPALSEAGVIAADAMTSQPFDFLKNLFATLSPANMRARPELRGILLQFLTIQAGESLSPNHPITLICQELQRDEDCQEVSRRGLQCMLDIFNTRLGRSRAVTIKLTDTLATLLRRNGEFDAARDIILELLKSCRQVYGLESDQARATENELAHLYMATEEWEKALEHCMSVVTQPSNKLLPRTEPAFYQDGIAAHTMEDIAEIHQRRGDLKQCIMWLERAASIALEIWGPKSLATGHIVDKMTHIQREFGKNLLESASKWEAALV
ncbi:hypothetical protein QBC35DRAFT_506976 [Podospora australis]|uniref:Clr5 domain-containing protein n=1 Tax=Podospora australis TaxID=1536484 RepID=A0AAN7AE74_9PEZI|nr:hypothetical protein QBC35DRAFT_506976 [Podospora australis]